MQILVDTNAYVAYLQGDRNVFAMLGLAERTLISVIVLGELYALDDEAPCSYRIHLAGQG